MEASHRLTSRAIGGQEFGVRCGPSVKIQETDGTAGFESWCLMWGTHGYPGHFNFPKEVFQCQFGP